MNQNINTNPLPVERCHRNGQKLVGGAMNQNINTNPLHYPPVERCHKIPTGTVKAWLVAQYLNTNPVCCHYPRPVNQKVLWNMFGYPQYMKYPMFVPVELYLKNCSKKCSNRVGVNRNTPACKTKRYSQGFLPHMQYMEHCAFRYGLLYLKCCPTFCPICPVERCLNDTCGAVKAIAPVNA